MFEQLVQKRQEAAINDEVCAELDAKFAELFAPMLEEKLAPLRALSDFRVEARVDRVVVTFDRKLPSGERASVSLEIEHQRAEYAGLRLFIYRGPYSARRKNPTIYSLTEQNAEKTLDRILQDQKREFELLLHNWD